MSTKKRQKSQQSIPLPACGMFVGSAVNVITRDYLFGSSGWHTKWVCRDYDPAWYIRKIVEDNQGNTTLLIYSNFQSACLKAMAQWMDLEALGLTIPEPDWKNKKYLVPGDWDEIAKHPDRFGAGILRFARQAKDNGIYTMVVYGRGRPHWVKKAHQQMGSWLLGLDIGEKFAFSGGYLKDGASPRKSARIRQLPTLHDLARLGMQNIKSYLRAVKKEGWQTTYTTSPSFRFDYEVSGGVDVPQVEDFAFSHLNVSSALSRGLIRQLHRDLWGSHLAHEHYSFLPYHSPYKFPMLKAALYLKYLSGAKLIMLESGNWWQVTALVDDTKMHQTPNLDIGGLQVVDPYQTAPAVPQARKQYKHLDYNSAICRRYRRVLSEFYDFVKSHGTPPGQPETTIAVVKGYLDGAEDEFNPNCPVWSATALAEQNPNWFAAAPEMGWEIVKDIYFPRENCLGPFKNKWFSGTPYGMIDIVSLNCPLDAQFLSRQYRALIFMAWNTATEQQYRLLKSYVRAGGKLFLSLPHLSTNVTREFRNYTVAELLHHGDFRDLCGVRVQGKGKPYYWAIIPNDNSPLHLPKNKRLGAWYTHTADLICDDDVEMIAVDDQSPTNNPTPILLRHPCGQGEVYFLNSWEYPGALANDVGTGAAVSSRGIPGEVLKMLGRQCRGHAWITDDGREVGPQCHYIAFSYFPSNGKTYLLNIDAAHPHTVVLHRNDQPNLNLRLKPYEFKIL